MSHIVSFECPRCGAPLQAVPGQLSVKCEYCGGTIVVPPELRPAPPPPPPQAPPTIIISSPQPANTMPVWTAADVAQPYSPPRVRRGGCISRLVAFTALVLIGLGVFGFFSARSPYFFDNLVAGGYARLDQTFDAQVDGANLLKAPMSVAVDSDNNIYVLDATSQAVIRFDQDGQFLNDWQVGGKDKQLEGLVPDNAGDVFVIVNGQLVKYDAASGNLLGKTEIPDIFGVGALCLMPDGTLLGYANGTSDSFVRFDQNGNETARIAKPISEHISGDAPVVWEVQMVAGQDGTLYLLSTAPTDDGVYVYGPDLKYKLHIGMDGEAEGQLDTPSAIAVDSKGRIYIDDWKGIQIFDDTGTYIGIIRLPFRDLAAGMAFNSDDELYFVSRTQDKVYKFVLNEPQ